MNRPTVSLEVTDFTPIIGRPCPLPDEDTPRFATGAAGRGRCLGLEATASGADHVSFAFTVDGQPAELAALWIDTAGLHAIAALSTAGLVTLPISPETVTFEVTVSGPDGSIAKASAGLAIIDTPPVAHANPPRTLPLGGLPTAPGAPYDVRFEDSGSSDIDGDSIREWCWTFPPGPEVCKTTPDDPAFTQSIVSTTRSRRVGRLRVSDGNLWSEPVLAEVRIKEPPLWLSFSGVIQRVDEHREGFTAAGTSVDSVAYFADDDGERAAISYPSASSTSSLLASFEVPTAAPQTVDLPLDPIVPATDVYIRFLGTDGTGDELVIVTVEDLSNIAHTYVRRFGWSTAGVGSEISSDEVVALDLSPYSLPSYVGAIFNVDAAGNVWLGKDGTFGVMTGSTFTLLDDPSFLDATAPRAIAFLPRPGSSPAETWVLKTPGGHSGGGGPSTFEIYRGATFVRSLPLSVTADAVAWIDDHEMWLSSKNERLLRVDVDYLLAGGSLDGATLTAGPDLLSMDIPILVDATNGAVYGEARSAIDNTRVAFQVRTDGSSNITAPGLTPPAFVDRSGAVWFVNLHDPEPYGFDATPWDIHPAWTADAAGVVVSRGYGSYSALPAVDPLTGGVWLPESSPASLVRVFEDGSMLAVKKLANGSAFEDVPPMVAAQCSPDGRFLWTVSYDSQFRLQRLDISGRPLDPPPVLLVATGSVAQGAQSYGLRPMGGTDSDRAWYSSPTNGSVYDISTIDVTGEVTPVHQFTPVPVYGWGYVLASALSSPSNRLCLATNDGGTVGMWRLSADGTLESFGTVTMQAIGSACQSVAASRVRDGVEQCWFAINECVNNLESNSRISLFAWAEPGSPALRQVVLSAAGNLSSVVPLDLDDAWATLEEPNIQYSQASRMIRLHFDTASTAETIPLQDLGKRATLMQRP